MWWYLILVCLFLYHFVVISYMSKTRTIHLDHQPNLVLHCYSVTRTTVTHWLVGQCVTRSQQINQTSKVDNIRWGSWRKIYVMCILFSKKLQLNGRQSGLRGVVLTTPSVRIRSSLVWTWRELCLLWLYLLLCLGTFHVEMQQNTSLSRYYTTWRRRRCFCFVHACSKHVVFFFIRIYRMYWFLVKKKNTEKYYIFVDLFC